VQQLAGRAWRRAASTEITISPSSAGGSRRPAPRAARTPARRYERPDSLSPLARTERPLFGGSACDHDVPARRRSRIGHGCPLRPELTPRRRGILDGTGLDATPPYHHWSSSTVGDDGDLAPDQRLARLPSVSHVERDFTSAFQRCLRPATARRSPEAPQRSPRTSRLTTGTATSRRHLTTATLDHLAMHAIRIHITSLDPRLYRWRRERCRW
jgi:hypothetical protein